MQCSHFIIILIICTVCFCEFFGDYLILFNCKWPQTHSEVINQYDLNSNKIHAMIIADTHLLGPLKGHWLDKLYREWHMKRAFRAAMQLHKPDVVFILGDLFDEGDMVDHVEFKEYIRRFYSIFNAPSSIPVISAVGNHDVGFHYKMHPYLLDRFEKYFNNTGVELYTMSGIHFVLINSMAMENDGCEFCETAINELQKVANKLNCLKIPEDCIAKNIEDHKYYSPPIVLQHFPTYRKSDESCNQHDAPHFEIYREKWEVLSKNSTDLLHKLLQPRLLFAGHTHHYCYSINMWGIEEYTVASFNWRNKINPSLLMVTLTPTSHDVFKCDMLQQQLVYNTYVVTLVVLVTIIILKYTKALKSLNIKSKDKKKISIK